MMNRAMKFISQWQAGMLFCFVSLFVSMVFLPGATFAAEATNRMVAINVEDSAEGIVLNLETEKPVGYRYTVYDSIDPIRVVVDFPGMDVEEVDTPEAPTGTTIKDVRLTSFDLTSGKLGRLEVVLDAATPYDVTLNNTSFNISFEPTQMAAEQVEQETGEAATMADQPETLPEEETAAAPEPVATEAEESTEESTMSAEAEAATADATTVSSVSIGDNSVSFNTDGHVEIFKYFTLGAPPRLVVDVYGVKAGFSEKKFSLGEGFERLRVGNYADKIRFVLDASDVIPDYSVSDTANSVYVAWGDAAEEGAPAKPEKASAGVPVNVETVDFKVEDSESVVQVTLSDPANVIPPSLKDGIVGFGVKNATISRSLRRAIDASSFPSSIRLVTPYTVLVGDKQDVRFAVELKGPSEYSLDTEGNVITLKVENGPFAEPDFIEDEQVAVEVAGQDVKAKVREDATPDATATETPTAEPMADEVGEMPAEDFAVTEDDDFVREIEREADTSVRQLSSAREMGYTGQRISLVFDNADIRNILQLIAEVSNLNILAGDGVDGTITLRLIDVPWDQALDLILETKDLGMLRDGNVARILPKESIRAMDEAKFTAARTKEKLQDLEKAVITVNYTDLANISGPAKEFLTDRGTITEDARNKKLIIKDIPKVIEDIRDLVAELDTPEKQVLIEARIVEVNTSANLNLGINWNILYSQDASFTASENTGGQVGLGGSFVVPAVGAGSGTSAGMGANFSWGRVGVDTTILDLRLSALETSGDGRVISNPRVMTLNGEQARISQGTQIPYQTVSDEGVQTELVEAALSLEVTPIINPDNSVILELLATNSRPGSTVQTGQGGSAPSIDTKEAETKMLVKDGETMVIGGIYVEQDDFSESGVPILMNIPLLGNLFKSTQTNKTRSELMVFITPRIVE